MVEPLNPNYRIVRHNERQNFIISSHKIRYLSLAGMIRGVVGHAFYLESDFPLFDQSKPKEPSYLVDGFTYGECHLARIEKDKKTTFVLVGTHVNDAVNVAIALNDARERQDLTDREMELARRDIILTDKIQVVWEGSIPRAFKLNMGEAGWTQMLYIFPDAYAVKESDKANAYQRLKSAVDAVSR